MPEATGNCFTRRRAAPLVGSMSLAAASTRLSLPVSAAPKGPSRLRRSSGAGSRASSSPSSAKQTRLSSR